MTTDWDKLSARLDEVKPATAVFRMCPDPDIRDAYLTARAEAETAKRRADEAQRAFQAAAESDDELGTKKAVALRLADAEKAEKDAQAALKKATAAYDRIVIPLTFRSIGRKAVEDLEKQHPPQEEDQEQGLDWHLATFAPALIAAASVDDMPEEAAARYLAEWTDPDAAALWTTAWGVQQVRRTDVGKG